MYYDLYLFLFYYATIWYSSLDLQEQRVNELTDDVKRIEYHSKYLAYLAKSIRLALKSDLYYIFFNLKVACLT
uniref:Uncharacterized protein n=1 Tax=Helianthus annuus TaxID=4232 RepID=A0A251USN6_HELAN